MPILVTLVSDGGGVYVATHGYKDGQEWILDSSSSFHMKPNNSFFLTCESVDWGNVLVEK